MSAAYDAGLLMAAERGDRRVWADHRVRLESGRLPVTTAPVVAQVSRSSRQVQLHRFLRGCDVRPMSVEQAHPVGDLLGRSGTSDVVDAHLVHVAVTAGVDAVLTTDPDDIGLLAETVGLRLAVRRL